MVAKDFKLGELVWAKMKGFSPWPAKIAFPSDGKMPKSRKPQHFVRFFGTRDYAWILDDFIEPHSSEMLKKSKMYKKISKTMQIAITEIKIAHKKVLNKRKKVMKVKKEPSDLSQTTKKRTPQIKIEKKKSKKRPTSGMSNSLDRDSKAQDKKKRKLSSKIQIKPDVSLEIKKKQSKKKPTTAISSHLKDSKLKREKTPKKLLKVKTEEQSSPKKSIQLKKASKQSTMAKKLLQVPVKTEPVEPPHKKSTQLAKKLSSKPKTNKKKSLTKVMGNLKDSTSKSVTKDKRLPNAEVKKTEEQSSPKKSIQLKKASKQSTMAKKLLQVPVKTEPVEPPHKKSTRLAKKLSSKPKTNKKKNLKKVMGNLKDSTSKSVTKDKRLPNAEVKKEPIAYEKDSPLKSTRKQSNMSKKPTPQKKTKIVKKITKKPVFGKPSNIKNECQSPGEEAKKNRKTTTKVRVKKEPVTSSHKESPRIAPPYDSSLPGPSTSNTTKESLQDGPKKYRRRTSNKEEPHSASTEVKIEDNSFLNSNLHFHNLHDVFPPCDWSLPGPSSSTTTQKSFQYTYDFSILSPSNSTTTNESLQDPYDWSLPGPSTSTTTTTNESLQDTYDWSLPGPSTSTTTRESLQDTFDWTLPGPSTSTTTTKKSLSNWALPGKSYYKIVSNKEKPQSESTEIKMEDNSFLNSKLRYQNDDLTVIPTYDSSRPSTSTTTTTTYAPNAFSMFDPSNLSTDGQQVPIFKGRIGFLGLGRVGSILVKNLLNSRHNVVVWNRTFYHSINEFFHLGAEWGTTPADVIGECDITFSCVSDAEAAKTIMFARNGIMEGFARVGDELTNKAYVEMTSIDPTTSEDFYEAIRMYGARYLEAPMIGTLQEIRDKSMTVLTSGDHDIFDECRPIFASLAKQALFIGPEIGVAFKMNLLVSVVMGTTFAAFGEVAELIKTLGIANDVFLDCFESGPLSCPLLNNKLKAMVENTSPIEFPLKHQQKELDMALQMNNEAGNQPLLIATAANESYKRAMNKYSEHDVSAIHKIYQFDT